VDDMLIELIRESNEAIRELSAAIRGLPLQIKQQKVAQLARVNYYNTIPSGRRVHTKIEALGLTKTVIELLNDGLTYAQISNQLGNIVSKSAIQRFAIRYKPKH
jgi:hypothetical protein